MTRRTSPDDESSIAITATLDSILASKQNQADIVRAFSHWLNMRGNVRYRPPIDVLLRYKVATLAPWATDVDDGVRATWRFAAAVDRVVVELFQRVLRDRLEIESENEPSS